MNSNVDYKQKNGALYLVTSSLSDSFPTDDRLDHFTDTFNKIVLQNNLAFVPASPARWLERRCWLPCPWCAGWSLICSLRPYFRPGSSRCRCPLRPCALLQARFWNDNIILCDHSGQSFKQFTFENYDSRVVPDLKTPHITTLGS